MWIFRTSPLPCLLAGLLWLVLPAVSQATERVLDYHVDIRLQASGDMAVTETIRVQAEGQQVRRGIFREFPTRYQDRYGNHFNVRFDVSGVRRNGRPEPFRTEQTGNGVRVYMGSADRELPAGVHEYLLAYTTSRQVGFFEDFDELYWNVTGSDWAFTIDRASMTLELPRPVNRDDLRLAFYTGHEGSQGRDAIAQMDGAGRVTFRTTRSLRPHEGLTVAVGFPKGLVREPSGADRAKHFFADNVAAFVLLLGLLLPLAWYLWAWNRIGRDPREGIIIPRFEPPTDLSPAACAYVRAMSFPDRAFAAALVNLGVKGYVRIDDDETFRLSRQPGNGSTGASRGEQMVMDTLFSAGRTHVELDHENHRVFGAARTALKKALRTEYLGRLFNQNSVYALPAFGMTVLAAAITAGLDGSLLLWGVFALLTLALHSVFLFLLRAPTPAGRKIMDEIEGFRMYLDTAEQDRLDRMQSPVLTPEVFETFLPYAFALGVENHWCERLAKELATGTTEATYQPHWYGGRRRGLAGLKRLGSGFGSEFSSAIAAASTPPGSASGSGGGGSSGGGGGGGGGGGW